MTKANSTGEVKVGEIEATETDGGSSGGLEGAGPLEARLQGRSSEINAVNEQMDEGGEQFEKDTIARDIDEMMKEVSELKVLGENVGGEIGYAGDMLDGTVPNSKPKSTGRLARSHERQLEVKEEIKEVPCTPETCQAQTTKERCVTAGPNCVWFDSPA